jgi:hypothetical protein
MGVAIAMLLGVIAVVIKTIKVDGKTTETETAKASEMAKASEATKDTETSSPAETAKSTEAAKASDTAKTSDTAKASDTKKGRETATATETAKPAGTATATDDDSLVEPAEAAHKRSLPKNSVLRVNVKPWANVSVDGQRPVETPTHFNLSAGTHTVTLINPNLNKREKRKITLRANEEKRIDIDWINP